MDCKKYKEEVAVIQLGLRLHVLVFQLTRYEERLYLIFSWVFLFQIWYSGFVIIEYEKMNVKYEIVLLLAAVQLVVLWFGS